MDRGALRIGGWGALGAGAAGLARLVVGISIQRSVSYGAAPQLLQALTLAGLGALAAVALACAAYGAWAALTPTTRLLRTVTLSGGLGAVAALGASATEAMRVAQPGPPSNVSQVVTYLALFATAVWMAGVCAVDWRRRRWPAWVRVAGTASAVFAMSAVVLRDLGALALPFTLVFWLGLGWALLRLAARTSE